MPKIVKTVRSTSSTRSFDEAFMNAIKAVASALGSDYVRNDDGSNTSIREYYILTDQIGYPGFCIVFHTDSYGGNGGQIKVQIRNTTSLNEPNDADFNVIESLLIPNGTNSFTPYNPMTCVVFMDSSKDTSTFFYSCY